MNGMIVTLAVAQLLATAASAQNWQDRAYSGQLSVQIDKAVKTDTVSASEATSLRGELGQLQELERTFSANGISEREHAILRSRSSALTRALSRAVASNWGGRDSSASGERRRADRYLRDYRFAGIAPVDRFPGDARVGQIVTGRIAELPQELRDQYVDDDHIYFGYNRGRVYKIDRRSQLILGLLDLPDTRRGNGKQ